jgi:acyl dehydratase
MPDWPDDRYPGQYLGRHEYAVDPSSIAAYTAATGDDNPWYRGDSPFGGPVAPALLLHSEQYAFPTRDWYLPNLYGNLHIRQEWELFRHVPVPSLLWTHGMIVDRYMRKDRDVVVLEFTVFAEGDVMVARGRCHQSFLRTENAETVVDRGAATRKAPRPEPVGEPLEVLQPVHRTASLELCRAFSGPATNYHNDLEEARKLGFPDVVVQGTMSTTFISEMLTRRFGAGWLEGGRMSLNLINVLWGGETVTARGAVREVIPEGSRRRAHLDVWTEKDDGTKTIAGTASAVVV